MIFLNFQILQTESIELLIFYAYNEAKFTTVPNTHDKCLEKTP